jgi:hypothetical protein
MGRNPASESLCGTAKAVRFPIRGDSIDRAGGTSEHTDNDAAIHGQRLGNS